MRCLQVRVAGVLHRSRSDSSPEFQGSIHCDDRKVLVPEMVFSQSVSAAARQIQQ
jgi:hypothetical protein